MPSFMRIGRIRLMIFPNDHEPPHVHAIGNQWHVKVALGNGEELKPRLVSFSQGKPKRQELRRVLLHVHLHARELWAAWRALNDRLDRSRD